MACRRPSFASLLFAIFTSLRLVRAQQNNNPQADGDVLFKFVTRPDIGAPKWNITVYDQEAITPGYWFLAPYANLAQTKYPLWNGAHIYDQRGELIWSGAPMFDHKNIHDLRVQTVNGVPMLTANFPADLLHGYGVIMDNSYTIVKTVDSVGNNAAPNMHDFNLINDGKTALMLTTEDAVATHVDLPWYSGTCKVKYQGFKEVDVETEEDVFEWNDKGYIGLNESDFKGAKTSPTFADVCNKEWGRLPYNFCVSSVWVLTIH